MHHAAILQFYSLYRVFTKTVTQLQQISLQARPDAEQSIASGQRGLCLAHTLKPMDDQVHTNI